MACRITASEIVSPNHQEDRAMDEAEHLIARFYGQNPPSFDRGVAVDMLSEIMDGGEEPSDLVSELLRRGG